MKEKNGGLVKGSVGIEEWGKEEVRVFSERVPTKVSKGAKAKRLSFGFGFGFGLGIGREGKGRSPPKTKSAFEPNSPPPHLHSPLLILGHLPLSGMFQVLHHHFISRDREYREYFL